MKTLSEHNEECLKRHIAFKTRMEPQANGIGCPVCGDELFDSSPELTVKMHDGPDQKYVSCQGCHFYGSRLL